MKYECKGTRVQITKSLKNLKESISHLNPCGHCFIRTTEAFGAYEKIIRNYICDDCGEPFSIEAYGAWVDRLPYPMGERASYCYTVLPEKVLSYIEKINNKRKQNPNIAYRSISIEDIENREDPVPKYKECARKFNELGFLAKVECLCGKCAQRRHPMKTDEKIRHYVFSFRAKGDRKWHCSFPNTKLFLDFDYRVALAFLKGYDTIEMLDSKFGLSHHYPYDYMQTYIRTIKRVLCK